MAILSWCGFLSPTCLLRKKRPAIVLSPSSHAARYGDVVVMQLTSAGDREPSLALTQWKTSGLLKPTWVKPVIGTLSLSLVDRRLGKITPADEPSVRSAIINLLDKRWMT